MKNMIKSVSTSFGDKPYSIINETMAQIFHLGEKLELSYAAYNLISLAIEQDENETFSLIYPLGQNLDGTVMQGNKECPKEYLRERYQHLGNVELAITSLYALVMWMESLFGDLIRTVVLGFPKKLDSKRKISLKAVLNADSLESVHLAATDSLLNELSYKSPRDFAADFKEITGINLLEIPAFHKYIEAKATRDIHIHNRGIANETYLEKSDSFARVKVGQHLPITINYFLSSYEACLQICECLKDAFHTIWHSSQFEADQSKSFGNNNASLASDCLTTESI